MQGYRPGEVPIINRKDHPREYREWYAYYGLRHLPFCQELMRERDSKTVPTHSPFDFDAEFSLPAALPEVPDDRFPPPIDRSPEVKARIARLVSPFNPAA